jgi:predicted dehydrogenase
MDDVDVVAVCDIDEDAATEAADPHDAAVFTDHETMFAEADFEALVLAVPPFAHEGQEIMAAEHDVDLLVEKPLGLDSETAREAEAAIEEAGIVTQVGHMNRYSNLVEEATSLIGDRTVAYIHGEWIGGVPPADWWGSMDHSGGQVVEQASHTFDLVRYFGGDVAEVRAAGSQRVVTEEIDFPDATSATMTHENGLVSHVATSSASPSGSNEVTIIGDGFHLDIQFGGTLSGVVDGEAVEIDGEGGNWGTELRAFIDAVQADDPSMPRSPYADARKTFETTLAVNEAIETGEVVDVEVN